MDTASMRPEWQAIREHLEAQRRQVLDLIRNYPAPITACDAQFNHLLEKREGLAEALRRLEALIAEGGAATEGESAIADFLDGCAHIDSELGARLRPTP